MSNEPYSERPAPAYSIPELSPTIKAPPVATESAPRWVSYGGNALLGLGLLLVGLPLAWLLGIGTTRIISAPGQRMPLQEVILRRSNRVITEIQRLPSRWQPTPPPETRIEPIPIPTQPVDPLTPPPAALNNRERQIAEEELAALQQEFETIRQRLFDLESTLGQAQSTESVEARLAHLERRLIPDQSPILAAPPESLPEPTATETLQDQNPLLETAELKITLPSDALFVPGEARLLSTAPDLLNSIFDDLRQHPDATILIGSHTDNHLEPSQSQKLAFQQANALRAYLAGNLPDHRWITIGYGQSHPITDDSTPALRQRNRRIEIAIDRR
ncbi:MAG: OmpA family protein [Cyanobacteria bacterium P01_C01_bin.118]